MSRRRGKSVTGNNIFQLDMTLLQAQPKLRLLLPLLITGASSNMDELLASSFLDNASKPLVKTMLPVNLVHVCRIQPLIFMHSLLRLFFFSLQHNVTCWNPTIRLLFI